tara:strand:+ start:805 stop:1074 length:270 start_codon:yes stop_codon:yes gene_type:complete
VRAQAERPAGIAETGVAYHEGVLEVHDAAIERRLPPKVVYVRLKATERALEALWLALTAMSLGVALGTVSAMSLVVRFASHIPRSMRSY